MKFNEFQNCHGFIFRKFYNNKLDIIFTRYEWNLES
jgi:hypothetical protein